MKISATTIPQRTEVTISKTDLLDSLYNIKINNNEILKIVKKRICKELSGRDDAYIEKKTWIWQEECHTSHVFWIDHDIKKATGIEIKLMSKLDSIIELLVTEKLNK